MLISVLLYLSMICVGSSNVDGAKGNSALQILILP